MDNKIIQLKKFQTKNDKKHMLLLIILTSVIVASLFWKFHIENQEILEAEIPQSQNINYNNAQPLALSPSDLATQIESARGKPTLIYFFTTWCSSCHENFAIFNEVAREFQNTELNVIAVAIDKDLNQSKVSSYIRAKGDIYFKPQYLISKAGFKEVLKEYKVKYKNRIPYTALYSKQGSLLIDYSGSRPARKLQIAIRRELLSEDF